MSTEKEERTILVGGGDPHLCNFLGAILRYRGYALEFAKEGAELLHYLRTRPASAVLLDGFESKRAIETLREIRTLDRRLPVIMLSSDAAPWNIVEAMKSGATNFLGKPVTREELLTALEDALDNHPAAGEVVSSKKERPETPSSDYWNPRMRDLYHMAERVAASETPIVIQGETGAGKEMLARHIHRHSRRADKAFVKLNCAALPSELVESELFGYERGAFTGAFQRKPGMFEIADGGTLLLDEIGDMDFKLQAKLLQVLQDHEFHRLGGKETIRVNVRVIAATHNDLEKAIARNTFREDLYYRLNVINLYVPPLRERKEDILPLVEILLQKHSLEPGTVEITPGLQQALLAHKWPGNVRELENVVRKLVVIRDPEMIRRDLSAGIARKTLAAVPALEAPANVQAIPASTPILEQVTYARHQAETEAILSALHATRWNRKKAAILLEIDYKALLYKMKKLGIENRPTTMSSSERAQAPTKAMAAGL